MLIYFSTSEVNHHHLIMLVLARFLLQFSRFVINMYLIGRHFETRWLLIFLFFYPISFKSLLLASIGKSFLNQLLSWLSE